MSFHIRKIFVVFLIAFALGTPQNSFASFSRKELILTGAGATFFIGLGVLIDNLRGKSNPSTSSTSTVEHLSDILETSLASEANIPVGSTHKLHLNMGQNEEPHCRYISYKLHNKGNRALTITEIGFISKGSGVTDFLLVDKNFIDNSGNFASADTYGVKPFVLEPGEDCILKIKVRLVQSEKGTKYIKVEGKSVSDDFTIHYNPKEEPIEYCITTTGTTARHVGDSTISGETNKPKPATSTSEQNYNTDKPKPGTSTSKQSGATNKPEPIDPTSEQSSDADKTESIASTSEQISKVEFVDPPTEEQFVSINDARKTLIYTIKNEGKTINQLRISGYSDPIRRSEEFNSNNNCREGENLDNQDLCKIEFIIGNLTEKNARFLHHVTISDGKEELKRYPINIRYLNFKATKATSFPEQIIIGEAEQLEYTIENTGNVDLDEVEFKFSSEGPSLLKAAENSSNILPIKPGEKRNFKLIPNSASREGDLKNISIHARSSKYNAKTKFEDPVKLKIKKLDFSIGKISEINTPTMPEGIPSSSADGKVEIIGATRLAGKILEYFVENTGSADINKIEIEGIAEPIKLEKEEGSDKSCNFSNLNLKPGDRCNIKLSVRPEKAGKILQELKVTAKTSGSRATRTDSSHIVLEALYKPHLLITREIIDEDVREILDKDTRRGMTGNFRFSMPIVVNGIDANKDAIKTDANSIEGKSIFVGTDRGVLEWTMIGDKPKWRRINRDQVVDMHIVGNCIYYVSGYSSCEDGDRFYCGKNNVIKCSCDGGKTWKSIEAEHVHGIHMVGGKIFVANNHKGPGILETHGDILSIKYLPNAVASDGEKIGAFKIFGEDNYLCIGDTTGLYFSSDLGENWRSYDLDKLKIFGFKDLTLQKIQGIYCGRETVIFGTNSRLYFSTDGGITWDISSWDKTPNGLYAENGEFWLAANKNLYVAKRLKSDGDWKAWMATKPLVPGKYTMMFFSKEKSPLLTGREAQELLRWYKEAKTTMEEKENIINKLYVSYYSKKHGDPCGILGVKGDANFDEIKKRYRELSLTFHPDKLCTGNKATIENMGKIMEMVNEAYEIIKKSANKPKENVP